MYLLQLVMLVIPVVAFETMVEDISQSGSTNWCGQASKHEVTAGRKGTGKSMELSILSVSAANAQSVK